jgi:hypothetical protein
MRASVLLGGDSWKLRDYFTFGKLAEARCSMALSSAS